MEISLHLGASVVQYKERKQVIQVKYERIKKGIFKERPNRFIAYVEIDGKTEVCHVKNTGRCRELLVPGATVFVQESDNPERKTRFDVISVYKGKTLFNIDSNAPNKVFFEWARESGYFGTIDIMKPECRYGNSRFDFYIETEGNKIFVEVKGVTLETDGVLKFPDAPTERGAKHLYELARCKEEGYSAYAVFIVQAECGAYFMPNQETDPAFSEALFQAKKAGVNILCLGCSVTADSLTINREIEVRL